jgi:hypothetical protein
MKYFLRPWCTKFVTGLAALRSKWAARLVAGCFVAPRSKTTAGILPQMGGNRCAMSLVAVSSAEEEQQALVGLIPGTEMFLRNGVRHRDSKHPINAPQGNSSIFVVWN